MESAKGGNTKGNGNGAKLGFEPTLWAAADKLRGHLDAAEYKHVVLGLIFLKYISDAFEARRQQLLAEVAHGADPEDPDEYRAENVFWVPTEARWERLQADAKDAQIGALLDRAMDAIEHENPSLRGVLPQDYNKPSLDKRRLAELVDLISTIGFDADAHKAQDILGRTYEYFLGQFAGREGKKGGEFYTPRSVVRLLVEMIEPYAGRVYDPCCGSSGIRSGVTAKTGRASNQVPGQFVVEDGDVLFSWSGSLIAVLWSGGRGALNQHLFRVTSQSHPRRMYYFWILEHLPGFQRIAAGKATTMGHIQRAHLSQAQCVVPTEAVIEKATDAIEPMLSAIVATGRESRLLAQFRDVLLPRLVSGQLRVGPQG